MRLLSRGRDTNFLREIDGLLIEPSNNILLSTVLGDKNINNLVVPEFLIPACHHKIFFASTNIESNFLSFRRIRAAIVAVKQGRLGKSREAIASTNRVSSLAGCVLCCSLTGV